MNHTHLKNFIFKLNLFNYFREQNLYAWILFRTWKYILINMRLHIIEVEL